MYVRRAAHALARSPCSSACVARDVIEGGRGIISRRINEATI